MDAPVLDLMPLNPAPHRGAITGPKIWSEQTIDPSDWIVTLSGELIGELKGAIAGLRDRALPTFMLDPGDFELDACRAVMQRVHAKVRDGHGFAVLDRLPLDDWTHEEALNAAWLLGRLLSRPVAQTPDGQVFHDVRDEGPPSGQGLSLGLTSTRLEFHQDNSGNRLVPTFVALLAIRVAAEGGANEYCTLASMHNALLADEPRALERLFRPYLHDRLGFEARNEPSILRAPALEWSQDRLVGRFSFNKISGGYRKAGIQPDREGLDALDAAVATIRNRTLAARHMLSPGQLFIFNNAEGLHHREPFQDGVGIDDRRHLVRIWFRDSGRPTFDG
jgi:hypothetical protein